MPTGLIRLIIKQKVLKTTSNESVKQQYLGSNQQCSSLLRHVLILTDPCLFYVTTFFLYVTTKLV